MSEGVSGTHFEALLKRLRADGKPAEAAYESLRRRLVALLRLHVPAEAEALADIALDRMGRRIHEGTVVENVHLYALGIGRMLILESHTQAARQRQAKREITHRAAGSEADHDAGGGAVASEAAEDEERMLAAVNACLKQLGQAASGLMLAYYSGDGAERIAQRQRLARDLGITVNALRNRALRLRTQLEQCARDRLAGEHTPRAAGDETADPDTSMSRGDLLAGRDRDS